MVKLASRFSQMGRVRILVVGDFFLDTYTVGKARRISPEAPVAVIQVTEEQDRPGGAGNVALNLVTLGADVVVLGRCGSDAAGNKLMTLLDSEGVDVTGLHYQAQYRTPVKNRIIADNQQIVRVDHEEIVMIPEVFEEVVIGDLKRLLVGVDIVAVSDYGKGFVTRTLMQAVIELAGETPVICDPKGVDFGKYRGATVIKPNLIEAYQAANLTPDAPLEEVAKRVLEKTEAKTLMITRSGEGISLFHNDGNRQDFPVKVREILDVTGAGDTVLAMIAHTMANGLPIDEATEFANIAAGIAVERFGCARITLREVARRLLENDVKSKVFDEKHLFALLEALKGRPYAILHVSEKEGLTPQLFQKMQAISKREGWDLLVYIEEESPSKPFVEMLAALQHISFIIIEKAALDRFLALATPTQPQPLKQVEK